MPQPPSWIFADATPGQSTATNEAMPRFGGKANPGETIRVSVDGETTTIAPTPAGTWEWTAPELADGEHEFEMWTEDAEGNESDHIEWENDVQASAQDREWRARNEEWKQSGARDFLDQNDHPQGTPPRAMTGGGGGAQQPLTDPAPTGPTQERPQTGGSPGGGTSSSGGAPSPQGLEKGNALQVG